MAMDFAADLGVFLNTSEFGVAVTADGVTGVGILDMPGMALLGDQVVSTDYRCVVKTSEFGGLLYGQEVTVDGENYTVKSAMMLDDGHLTELMLSKLAVGASGPGADPRQFSLTDLSDVTVTDPQAGDVLVHDGDQWVNNDAIEGGTP